MKRRSFIAQVLGATGLAAPPGAAFAEKRPAEAPEFSPSITAGYFGMHFHRLLPLPGVQLLTVWPPSLIGSMRMCNTTTRWADLEPRPGRWDFDRFDAHVALAEANGASVLYSLGSTPRWASARPDEPGPYGPGCAAEPRSMADWEDYVRRVAQRYRGRVAAYEVWNEPYFSDLAADRGQPAFFTGSLAQMIEMTQIARRAIKEVDKTALLTTPGFVGGPHRLDRYLAAGGADLVDAIAYHFYASDATQFASEVEAVRSVMARRRVAGLPLWNTECGIDSVSAGAPAAAGAAAQQADRVAAARLSQFLILGAAARFENFYYHAWDNYLSGMVDRTGVANARLPAYEQTRRWLLGSRLAPALPLGPGAFRVDAEAGGHRYSFAWSDRDAVVDLRLPSGWRIDAIESLFADAISKTTAAVGSSALGLTMAPTRIRIVRDRWS